MILHILSTAATHWPLQEATSGTDSRSLLYAATTIRAMSDAANWPRPCIAKTAAVFYQLHIETLEPYHTYDTASVFSA